MADNNPSIKAVLNVDTGKSEVKLEQLDRAVDKLGAEMQEASNTSMSLSDKILNASNIAKGAIGGFTALSGIVGLLSKKNEVLSDAFAKTQVVLMSVLGGIDALANGISATMRIMPGLIASFKALNTVMKANVIIAVASAVAALTVKVVEWAKANKEAAESQQAINEQLREQQERADFNAKAVDALLKSRAEILELEELSFQREKKYYEMIGNSEKEILKLEENRFKSRSSTLEEVIKQVDINAINYNEITGKLWAMYFKEQAEYNTKILEAEDRATVERIRKKEEREAEALEKEKEREAEALALRIENWRQYYIFLQGNAETLKNMPFPYTPDELREEEEMLDNFVEIEEKKRAEIEKTKETIWSVVGQVQAANDALQDIFSKMGQVYAMDAQNQMDAISIKQQGMDSESAAYKKLEKEKEKIAKESFDRQKNFDAVMTVMDGLRASVGIIQSFSGMGVPGVIAGIALAAGQLAASLAVADKIRQQQYVGSSSAGGGGAAAAVQMPEMPVLVNPIQETHNNMTADETRMINETKYVPVLVAEDVSEAQNAQRVKVTTSNPY